MKKKLIVIGLIIIVVGGGGVLLFNSATDSVDTALTKRTLNDKIRPAPTFSLKNYEGQIVKLSDFSDQPLVINSWAVWCPFCKEELLYFARAQKRFGDQVTFIAIDRAEPLSTVQKYSDELGVTDDLVMLLDPKDSFYQSIGGFAMPETIFVDAEGNIREHKRGPMGLKEIIEKTNSIL